MCLKSFVKDLSLECILQAVYSLQRPLSQGEKVVEVRKTCCWFCVMEFCFPLGTGRKPVISGPCSVLLRYARDELFQSELLLC